MHRFTRIFYLFLFVALGLLWAAGFDGRHAMAKDGKERGSACQSGNCMTPGDAVGPRRSYTPAPSFPSPGSSGGSTGPLGPSRPDPDLGRTSTSPHNTTLPYGYERRYPDVYNPRRGYEMRGR